MNQDVKFLPFRPHPSYDDYLRLEKTSIGHEAAEHLRRIGSELGQESLPRYLSAAGWAAAEAAIIAEQHPREWRHSRLAEAKSYWTQAEELQEQINNEGTRPHLLYHSLPFRLRTDQAFLPLFGEMVDESISYGNLEELYVKLLQIGQHAAVRYHLSLQSGDDEARADFVGFLHEHNALLAIARLRSPTLLAVPSSARADNGHFFPEETHDAQLLHLSWGKILTQIPIEVKAAPSRAQRERYKAVLLRGKMHLTTRVSHSPIDTILSHTREYEGCASAEEVADLKEMTLSIDQLVRDYKARRHLARRAIPEQSRPAVLNDSASLPITA